MDPNDDAKWAVEVVLAARLKRSLRTTTRALRRQADALEKVAAGLRTRALPPARERGAERGGDAA